MFADLIGRKLGRYTIQAAIGQGGAARVYRAAQEDTGREVAIKVLPPQFLQDEDFMEWFMREAQAIAALQHPHIAPIYDYGEEGGLPYLVMGTYAGGTLGDRIAQSPRGLPLEEIVPVVSQVADALDYAHSQNIIHRNIKPANILLDASGNAYLADFGIVRVREASARLTGAKVIGTPAYMAPELATPGGSGPLADIYALGVTLWEMLVGRPPFEARGQIATLLAHVNQPIPDLRERRPDLPPGLQTVIERVLAKSPEARYASAGALAADLRAAGTEKPASPAARTVPETRPLPEAEVAALRTVVEAEPPATLAASHSPLPAAPEPPSTLIVDRRQMPAAAVSPAAAWSAGPSARRRKKSRTWVWVLLALLGAAACLFALLAVFGGLWFLGF